MNKIDYKFKKRFGQNFLQDNAVIERIVSSTDLKDNDLTIEIGPGSGVLTKQLLKKSNVLAYEIDKDLKEILEKDIISNKFSIIWDDFLNRDVNQDIKDLHFNNLYIIANLPYYITTPIILKIIKEKLPVSQITVMVQEEVADRFNSSPGSKEYGSITVLLNYYFEIKKLFKVGKNSFYPKPNVDSAVITLVPKKNKNKVDNEEKFFNFVRQCFKYKRKTIKNNLSEYNLEKIEKVLNKYNFNLSSRAEQLSLDIFIDLYNNL